MTPPPEYVYFLLEPPVTEEQFTTGILGTIAQLLEGTKIVSIHGLARAPQAPDIPNVIGLAITHIGNKKLRASQLGDLIYKFNATSKVQISVLDAPTVEFSPTFTQ